MVVKMVVESLIKCLLRYGASLVKWHGVESNNIKQNRVGQFCEEKGV